MLRAAALALLLLTFMPAPAGAQGDTADPFLTDPAGDALLTLQDVPVPGVGGTLYPSVDLRSLAILESRSDLTFTLGLEQLRSGQDPGADGAVHEVLFGHNGRQFRLVFLDFLVALSGPIAFLESRDADGPWSDLARFEVRSDAQAKTLAADVPRGLLADADGAAPYPGRTLDAVHVVAHSAMDGFFFVDGGEPLVRAPQRVADSMPDDDAVAPAFPIQVGVAQTGHAFLSSKMPFRASNGEATTYILTADAQNLGDEPDTFTFRVVGASNQLTVVVPIQVLALEAGAKHEVPVLATVPFGHRHGDLESFILEMTSQTDPGSVGRIEMGVRFLAVPQPAGHHNQVFLHHAATNLALLPFPEGYLNTLEEDPAATALNYYTAGFSGSGSTWSHSWHYRLNPGLEMGLDFDPSQSATIRLPIGSTWPMLAPQVVGLLFTAEDTGYSYSYTDRLPLAQFSTTLPDLLPNAPQVVEAEWLLDEEVDRIAHEPGRNLYLQVTLTTVTPPSPLLGVANEGAYISPGGHMRLPLVEWHDPVDDVLAALSGPGLSPLGAQERLVNPGKAAVFHVSIANPTDKTARILLEVSGPNAEWATLPAISVDVPAHDTARASVVVRAPAGTVSGERADLVLQAYSKDDPAARGLLRFVTIVDTDTQHPDDTAAADELAKKESPASGLAISLAAVALLALLRRRQR